MTSRLLVEAAETADKAASVAHDFIWEKNDVTKDEASRAIWRIHDALRPLITRAEFVSGRHDNKETMFEKLREVEVAAKRGSGRDADQIIDLFSSLLDVAEATARAVTPTGGIYSSEGPALASRLVAFYTTIEKINIA